MTSFKTGDKVLWTEDLTTTFEIKAIKELPTGRIVVAEFAQVPDGMAPFKLETPDHKCIPVPDGWQDAPQRPACCGGRFDGAAQDEAARHEWFVAMQIWDNQYKQPLLAKLSQGDEEVEISSEASQAIDGGTMYDPVIEDALADNLLPSRFDELRASLLHHHNLPDISGAIVYSGGGWYIALGFGSDKIEGKGRTLAAAVKDAIQPRNPLSPEEQLLEALKNDPATLRLAQLALRVDVSAGAAAP